MGPLPGTGGPDGGRGAGGVGLTLIPDLKSPIHFLSRRNLPMETTIGM